MLATELFIIPKLTFTLVQSISDHAENWRDILVMTMETTDTTVQGYRCVAWLEELARVSMALLGGL